MVLVSTSCVLRIKDDKIHKLLGTRFPTNGSYYNLFMIIFIIGIILIFTIIMVIIGHSRRPCRKHRRVSGPLMRGGWKALADKCPLSWAQPWPPTGFPMTGLVLRLTRQYDSIEVTEHGPRVLVSRGHTRHGSGLQSQRDPGRRGPREQSKS